MLITEEHKERLQKIYSEIRREQKYLEWKLEKDKDNRELSNTCLRLSNAMREISSALRELGPQRPVRY